MREACADPRPSLEYLSWYDSGKLRSATVLVAGAGALGSVVIEHLVRNGVGCLLIVDRDTVEGDNLSRSYTRKDIGRAKAAAAAEHAAGIDSSVRVVPIHRDVEDLGVGVFRAADVIVGCVDSRRSRAALNERACFARRRYIDGGIDGETMSGVVRVIHPSSAHGYSCLLCMWSSRDFDLFRHEYSCARIRPARAPTTSTIAGCIASIQSQEVLQYLLGRGQDLGVETGEALEYRVQGERPYLIRRFTLPARTSCVVDHDNGVREDRFLSMKGVEHVTAATLLHVCRFHLGTEEVTVRLERTLAFGFGQGARMEAVATPQERALPTHVLTSRDLEALGERTLAEIGLPPGDVIRVSGPGEDSPREFYVQFDFDLAACGQSDRRDA